MIEIVSVGLFGGDDDFIPALAEPSISDICADGIIRRGSTLRDDGDLGP
jgi:hypothetical protein